MKRTHLVNLIAIALSVSEFSVQAADSTSPVAVPGLVFDDVYGIVAVEAEHFYQQTITTKRAWHITSSKSAPDLKPDADPTHVAGASGGAYLEILPDTRVTSKDKLIKDENFTEEPGTMAALHYKVNFNMPGRYYVWVRAYSTGAEDNGLHVGIDGQWPESGQRWQTVQKNKWAWESKQRTEQNHTGEPFELFLDIEKAGEHEIMFSLREDGFEMDKFVLASNKEFKPEGTGPAVKVKSGTLPAAFPEVAEAAPAPKPFPAHWGEPPAIQTRDLQPLPGGYGEGSGTLIKWIQVNLEKDAAAAAGSLKLEASGFTLVGTGYYLDKDRWMAINPNQRKTATAKHAFPFPSGRYDVTLEAVGEEDGKSTYSVTVNDAKMGDFECPLAATAMEEGVAFHAVWKNQQVDSGDIIAVSSTIASADGVEYSRARWGRITFAPADDATKAAAANLKPADKDGAGASASSPASEVALAPFVSQRQADGKGTVAISGELKQWHKVTLTLDGPFAHERDTRPNPFTDLAFSVTFTHESGSPKYAVPGYFAADGQAANSSAESGTKWIAHLSPDKTGTWNYAVSFTQGNHAALDRGGQVLNPFDGITGTFTIAASDKTGRDFRSKGRLQYVGKHHLQFAGSKEYFLKAGPDSPETLLGYAEFDNTSAGKPAKVPLHTWAPHVQDWRAGDPTWKDGKGKGLIGALNYLSAKGVNAFSFLTYNASGDGDNVWPFVERNDKLHYDCSKLDQWGTIFDHATQLGLYLHFKLQENEMDDDRRGPDSKTGRVPESLDGGKLGPERKLYCRELIARFGHALALNWNIGEENTQSPEEVRDMVKYLHETDPYQHHIVLHTFPPQQALRYNPLIGNQSLLTGVSLQNSWKSAHERALHWIRASDAAGRPWVVALDEQNPAGLGVPPDPGYKGHEGIAIEKNRKKQNATTGDVKSEPYTLHDVRKLTLWGSLMAGGAGVEYYFGYALPENDLNCEDFRARDSSWDSCHIALDFFRENSIPFWEMKNSNALIGNSKNDNSKYCFAKAGELYLVYLPTGGGTGIDLAGTTGTFGVKWFNPREGGALQAFGSAALEGGTKGNITAPSADDWLAVVAKK